MATSAQHIAARADTDLLQRIIAVAEQAGIDNAQQWAESNMGRIVSTPVQVAGETTTIADVHAYADGVRKSALAQIPAAAGLNPSAVTDPHLAAAINAARDTSAH